MSHQQGEKGTGDGGLGGKLEENMDVDCHHIHNWNRSRRGRAEIPSREDQATWLKATGQQLGENTQDSPGCLGADAVSSYGDLAVSPALLPNLPGPRCSHTGSSKGNGGNKGHRVTKSRPLASFPRSVQVLQHVFLLGKR